MPRWLIFLLGFVAAFALVWAVTEPAKRPVIIQSSQGTDV